MYFHLYICSFLSKYYIPPNSYSKKILFFLSVARFSFLSLFLQKRSQYILMTLSVDLSLAPFLLRLQWVVHFQQGLQLQMELCRKSLGRILLLHFQLPCCSFSKESGTYLLPSSIPSFICTNWSCLHCVVMEF